MPVQSPVVPSKNGSGNPSSTGHPCPDPEIFCNCGCCFCRLITDQCRFIRGCDYKHRTLQTFRPRSRSINSPTSRPRSPISAITLISAFVFLANIPSKVLFPTPLPAKMPIRCPFPIVKDHPPLLPQVEALHQSTFV